MGDFLEISATDVAQMRKVAVKWCVVDATASLVAKAWSTTCIATNCSEGSHGVFPPMVGIWLAISLFVQRLKPQASQEIEESVKQGGEYTWLYSLCS